MGLGQVLVDGEVVAEDADAADLAGVPGPRHQRAPVHRVVLRHLQPVAALDVEADLVLRVQFNICSHHIVSYLESIHNSSIDIFMHLFGSFG